MRLIASLFYSNVQNWDDTIIALATPAGVGALAVLRISGPSAFSLVQRLLPFQDLGKKKSHSAFLGKLAWAGQPLDEALVTKFSGPRSFTGEDVIELSLHGSPYVVQEVLKACLANGCRLAAAGEFTKRAFLNRKLDLSQAEAVGDLIMAESEAAHRTALHQLKGGLSREIQHLRQQLIDFAALVELELDFGEEDVEFADRARLRALIQEINQHINKLLQSFSTGQAIKNGIPIVIVGPPNAGKSTLLNALLEEEKAIVSPIAGTTRDVIEDTVVLEGIQFRFVDTAGLRQTEDEVEKIGIARTKTRLEQASFALLLQGPDSVEDEVVEIEKEIVRMGIPFLKVLTKNDLYSPDAEGFSLSAATGAGLSALKQALVEKTVNQNMLRSENTLITNIRHFEALQKTQQALEQTDLALGREVSGDLLATDIREALFHLGSITGEITVEDVLGSIFSRFCIGK